MTTRICVVGCSGAGKSTLAAAAAAARGVEHVELDGIFHQPDWTPLPTQQFRDRLADRLAAAEARGGWVVDGNYVSEVADLTVGAADTVVVLDLPRRTVMRQVVWRSTRRLVLREELWNGNRERWREVFAWDPQRSIVRWAWTRHGHYHRRYTQLAAEFPDRCLVVRSRRERDAVLRRLSSP